MLSSLRVKNYTIFYMYITQGQGQITPRGQNFDCNLQVLLLKSYIVSFSHYSLIRFEKMTFQHFPHTKAWGCKFDLAVTNLVTLSPGCYIPRLTLEAIFVLEKKTPYTGMAAILFNGAEPFRQIVNTLLTESPM